jgi:hypothetical protein
MGTRRLELLTSAASKGSTVESVTALIDGERQLEVEPNLSGQRARRDVVRAAEG